MKPVLQAESGTPPIGKRVFGDLYVHIDYLQYIYVVEKLKELVELALSSISPDDLKLCNVAKINIDRNRLSFLQYLDFEQDPFPSLNGSWVFDPIAQKFSLRSYATSFNPPILHRKELLVGRDHPRRPAWEETTKMAESLGLFSSECPIGFKLNWQRLIADKGFVLEGDQFLPLGNQVDPVALEVPEGGMSIQRHLTALSRSTLSAPIQLLISHGLITTSVELFDYGCGRGDDLKGLESLGFPCRGWDPHYANDNALVQADVVNLGFVVNVIEDPAERVEAIQKAFTLARVALAVSVMLHSKDRPGRPYRDGFLTSRSTFQKYFSQDEFRDYLEKILEQEPIMIGPGIALLFSDKEAEQRFLLGRYRCSNVARRILSARSSPRAPGQPREIKLRIPKTTQAEREYKELFPILNRIWTVALDLGRFPELYEIPDFNEVQEKLSFTRARRLIRTHFDFELLHKASQTRSDEIRLFFAARQFSKREPYRALEPRLKLDIKYFFRDYKNANAEALKLLIDTGNPDAIRMACEEAASEGLGWLEENSHSLQLHRSLIERLPSVLRAYINCGLILWDNVSDFQLIKVHVASGKLTLLQYDNFDHHPIPLLIKRIKINIPLLDYDIFEYESPKFPPTPLLFKSRYMHEDQLGYADQVEFDEAIDATGILDSFESVPMLTQINAHLSLKRLEISGLRLQKSSRIPPPEQACGRHLTFQDLIRCGATQARLGIPNLPLNPETYNSLFELATQVLDPVIEYFGSIRLTYGFSSPELTAKISSSTAPKLDQHASHECDKHGMPICSRLGAAVDFLVEDEDMVEVAQWITENLQFDRLYLYGRQKPLHISYSSTPSGLVTFMVPSAAGRLMPRNCTLKELSDFVAVLKNF
jgi:DNA phosphorothioation-associated putative methyltransferase